MGWTFHFQATETIKDYDEWIDNVNQAEYIIDEYGIIILVDELIDLIDRKRNEKT